MFRLRPLPTLLLVLQTTRLLAGAPPVPPENGKAVGTFTVNGKTWAVACAAAVSRPWEYDPNQVELRLVLTGTPVPSGEDLWHAGSAPAVRATIAPKPSRMVNLLYEGGGSFGCNDEFAIELTVNDGKSVAGRIHTPKGLAIGSLKAGFDIAFRAAVSATK
jgi:hypothetical protein